MLQESSATVSHVLGQTNAGIGNICHGTFMNVPQYLLVKVQLAIWFKQAIPTQHLQPAICWARHIAFNNGLHTRKGALLTSHLKKLGGSLTCLLQDCLSIPHLSWAQSTESRLPMLEASSATVSHASGQSNAAGIGIICQGDSWMFHSTCLERCAEKSGFKRAFPHMHLQLARRCAMQVASKKLFDKRKEELLTSHLNELGDSLTCLLQDCLNTPHLW